MLIQMATLQRERAQSFRPAESMPHLPPHGVVQAEVKHLKLKQLRVVAQLVAKATCECVVDLGVARDGLVEDCFFLLFGVFGLLFGRP